MKATDVQTIFPRVLAVGEYGQGKTYLLGLLHELYKLAGTKGMKLYDFDGGYPTLTAHKFDVEFELCVDKKPQPNKPIPPLAWDHFAYDTEKYVQDNDGYGILGIDSLTSVQTACMNKVIKINNLKDRRFAGTINLTTQNDFGVLVGIMNQFFPQFINLSEHMAIVLTCHIRLETPVDKEGKPIGETRWYPAIAGRALPTQIGLWFNEVIMVKSIGFGNGARRVIQTSKDDKISLKSQIADVPAENSFGEYLIRLAHSYRILDTVRLNALITSNKLGPVNLNLSQADVARIKKDLNVI